MFFKAFTPDKELCVVTCIKDYINRTSFINLDDDVDRNQLISFAGDHKHVGSDIDITVSTAHSLRKASTSKENNVGLSFEDVAKAAGWSGESTFQRFYNLPISVNRGTNLLKNFSGTTEETEESLLN